MKGMVDRTIGAVEVGGDWGRGHEGLVGGESTMLQGLMDNCNVTEMGQLWKGQTGSGAGSKMAGSFRAGVRITPHKKPK